MIVPVERRLSRRGRRGAGSRSRRSTCRAPAEAPAEVPTEDTACCDVPLHLRIRRSRTGRRRISIRLTKAKGPAAIMRQVLFGNEMMIRRVRSRSPSMDFVA